MNLRRQAFLRDIGKELVEENVAIFAGAGLSVGAGFVDWKELLRPIADELGLDIERESDLVSLAQYHCNDNANNRSQLNQRLIEEFSRLAVETENHKILSRLPIRTFWTTNYDKVIENSIELAGKVVDVKYTKEHLSTTKPKRNAVVYKMHGDVDHPNQAVLTKDDYEKYHVKMDQYLSNLKGDLISKTFIFIGFSFSDPNLDYILSRVRVAYDGYQRRHYCFLRSVKKLDDENDADFEYRERKQQLFLKDLERFNIKPILVDEYGEITELLSLLERQYRSGTAFVSGAAHTYGPWQESVALSFVHKMSYKLSEKGIKVVSGFGLGIGSSVISGVLEQFYMTSRGAVEERLILRPFPQSNEGEVPLPQLWRKYREDMIAHAGIAIFLFGNKFSEGKVILSNGMREEVEIARSQGILIIPVGVTGYIAEEIWNEEIKKIRQSEVYSKEFKDLFSKLGDKHLPPDELLNVITDICENFKKG